ncbi:MAG: DUF268 domain-containing protein [Bacteroidota bacterium]
MKILSVINRLIVKPWKEGTFFVSLRRYPKFFTQWSAYRSRSSEFVPFAALTPQLNDATEETPFDPHYFYQSAWCARKIASARPEKHVDIASQINLIAPLSAFVPVEFIDYRPLNVKLNNLVSRGGTITALPFDDASVRSLSCLHVIEHIGLGRYGDEIDPDGNRKACRELQRILSPEGDLYLSTPVGSERVMFNAHRVHSVRTICGFFDELELVSFSCVDDDGTYAENCAPEITERFSYGVGLFHFKRKR